MSYIHDEKALALSRQVMGIIDTPMHEAQLQAKIQCLFVEAMEFSSAVPDGWIKCSDRIPEQYKGVLIADADGSIYIAALNRSMEWDDGDFNDHIENVTHWQPLPATPKSTTNEP